MSRIDIPALAAIHGVQSLVFTMLARPIQDFGFVRMTSSGDEPVRVEARISEERYKVADDYKITLVPVDPKYAYESYYIVDFLSLMRSQPDDYNVRVEFIGDTH